MLAMELLRIGGMRRRMMMIRVVVVVVVEVCIWRKERSREEREGGRRPGFKR